MDDSLEKDCPSSRQYIDRPTDVAECYRDSEIPAHSYPVADGAIISKNEFVVSLLFTMYRIIMNKEIFSEEID